MVFDDLINHEVTDTEGDAKKEIPIQMITRISNQSNQLKIVCIDEERFTDLGISDTADIKISEEAHNISTYTLTVKDVLNPKTLIVEAASSHELQIIEEFFSNKFITATLRKKVQTASLNHLPLNTIMNDVNEYIIPLNGCLSPKKDKAITLTVLGCILAIESKNINNNHINDEISFKDQETDKEEGFSLPIFRSEVINQLSRMGIEKPLKPVKQGGMIGLEAIDYIVERFYLSSKHQGICPAIVSVIGSLAVQEAIKSVTHIHYPISQLFLFEYLDSLHYQVTDNESAESDDGLQDHETETVLVSSKSKKKSMKKQNHLKSFDALINAEKVYGSEVIQELKQMKLFIVGAGAIGCELLKTLAMLGVGCGDENVISNEEVSDIDNKWKSIENGGIIITDMDTVERSNLNRQLLYREKHIGLSKSLVSSEMIKEINPSMKIIALTNKVSPDTENLFNSEFWSNVDVVLPALDNIDARLYVDSQCVRYYKWMIDSGTLGTRGSTQVVVPGFSESYASSADPPEEAIPLCTLKSFPYQPEHCIAWARALFDRVFNEEVRQLQSILQLAYQTNLSDGKNYDSNVDDLLKNLTPEGLESLNENLISFPCTPSSAIEWAIRLFHTLFMVEVKNLLQEHPPDDIDEEGAPFWGG
jgi:molybdopterin/thiamine biosynthesis adenylyltransferase